MISTLFVIEALQKGVLGILLTLDTIIYWLIGGAFKIFMAIAGARLLSSDAYSAIANKIYIIIGVVMLFVLSYALLRAIIDPDKESKGEFGAKMLGRIVTAVLGLAIAPFLFNFMYQLQGKILEDDIIGKLFFRIESNEKIDTSGSVTLEDGSTLNFGDSQTNVDEYVKSIGGAMTAVNLWQAFFFPAEDTGLGADEIYVDADELMASGIGNALMCAGAAVGAVAAIAWIPYVGWLIGGIAGAVAVASCINSYNDISNSSKISDMTEDGHITLEEAYQVASATGEFSIFTAFLGKYVDDGEITYLFIVSTIAGGFALYAFVSFSIDMGIRAAMLAYLQIIAPVPLILQVLPKFKDNLSKYISKVLGTFMEVFVRISVVYVVVYIICHLTELFGSVSTWQQENGLSTIQQVLALALLILGLIAFARKAPDLISETLNLPKGNMNLGIGKKLADGGFYSGRSIASSGVKSAVNAWNNAKPRNGADKATFGQKFGAAAAGLGLGTARAVRSNFIGPDHKEAKTAKEAKALTDRTAESVGTTLQNNYDRRDRHDRYDEQAQQLQDMMNQAQEDMRNATNLNDYNDAKARYEKALKDYQEAKAKARENTIVGAAITDLQNRAQAWAVGTVDTTKEEAIMKFGNSLDSLKGNLREEAYKKDTYGAKQLKQEYDRLQSEPLKLYADGYDETSANEELRKRRQILSDPTNAINIGARDLEAARTAFEAVKNLGPGDVRYVAAKNALDSARNNLLVEINNAGLSQTWLGQDDKLSVDISDIKIDENTAKTIRAREIESARQAMEAAADAWLQQQTTDPTSNTFRDVQKFLADNAEFIANNSTIQIVTGYDSNNEPIYETLSTVLQNRFGTDSIKGKYTPRPGTSSEEAFMEVELSAADPAISSANQKKVTYKPVYGTDGKVERYIPYDEDGRVITGSALNPEYTASEFFFKIQERMNSKNVSKVSSKTALSTASDIGKTASRHVANNEYAEKIQRKRQQQEGKK